MPLFIMEKGEVLEAGSVRVTLLEVRGNQSTLDVRAPSNCPVRRVAAETKGGREVPKEIVASPSVGSAAERLSVVRGPGPAFPLQSGLGPWCEGCGGTLSHRGGEYVCDFCR